MLLTKLDLWLGKNLFVRPIIKFCQWTHQTQFAVSRLFCSMASTGLFASLEGNLVPDHDRAKIDELWSPFAAAWYEEGKDDPKLRLIRFDPSSAQVWLNENSLFAGVNLLLGSDPKKDYADKVAELDLSSD